MKANQFHQTVIGEDDLIEIFYLDQDINQVVVTDQTWIQKFNNNCQKYDVSGQIDWDLEFTGNGDEFIQKNFSDWNLPDEYLQFDLQEYLLKKCTSSEQTARVKLELVEFEQRGMIIVLKWLKYFVDTMTANNLIWGVGRGSSVASYVLYLLEVHRVDAIKYNLSIREFLK